MKKKCVDLPCLTSTDMVGAEISFYKSFAALNLIEENDSLLSGSRETMPFPLDAQILNDGSNANENTYIEFKKINITLLVNYRFLNNSASKLLKNSKRTIQNLPNAIINHHSLKININYEYHS